MKSWTVSACLYASPLVLTEGLRTLAYIVNHWSSRPTECLAATTLPTWTRITSSILALSVATPRCRSQEIPSKHAAHGGGCFSSNSLQSIKEDRPNRKIFILHKRPPSVFDATASTEKWASISVSATMDQTHVRYWL